MATVDYRKLLAKYLRLESRRALAVGLVLTASQVVPLAGPILLRRFVDEAAAKAVTARLAEIALGYLAVAVVAQILSVGAIWLGTALAWRVTDRIRADLAAHVLGLDFGWVSRRSPGELIERVDDDVTGMSEYYSQVVLQLVAAVMLILGVLILVWWQDWHVGGVLAFSLAITALVVRRVQDHAVPATAANRQADAELFGTVQENLDGIEDLRANGGGDHALRRFYLASAVSYRTRNRAELDAAVALVSVHFGFALATAAVLATGVWLYRAGTVTIGTVFLLFQCMRLIRGALERLFDQLRNLQKAGAGAARVAGLLTLAPTVRSGAADPPPLGMLSVAFDGVSFSYPNAGSDNDAPPALHNVNFDIAPGAVLGVVGRTGSGKSTLLRLLARLYDPSHGAITIDGVDIRDLSLPDLRAAIGFVTQDVQLFRATVRENVTLFGPGDDDLIRQVLCELELGEWLDRLPRGLDTIVGTNDGAGLSAGEAQLLAFARVFLRDPGVVVLDEASSRLDPETQRRIDRAIGRLLRGRTGILVAHRLDTLVRADEILVLEGGTVAEQGPRVALADDPSSRFGQLLQLAGVAP